MAGVRVEIGASEFCGRDAPVADATFFVRAFDAELHRPQWPWREWRAFVGRLRHDLELVHGERLLAMTGSEAIGACVAASDDDDAFAGGQNFCFGCDSVAQRAAILLGQEIHREMNSL